DIMQNINRDVISNIHTEHYLTGFLGIIDLLTNTITFTRASHPQPIVVRRSGEIFTLTSSGTFIGMVENPQYQQQSFTFEKGDRLYLFTDGIYEIVEKNNTRKHRFGYRNFSDIVASCNSLAIDEIIPAIQERLSQFSYEDDYTLIVAEFTSSGLKESLCKRAGFDPLDSAVQMIIFQRFVEGLAQFGRIYECMQERLFGEDEIHHVKICLNELVFNALEHGNKNDPKKSVTVIFSVTAARATVAVIDEGEGFSLGAMMDPTKLENLNKDKGRGLYLIQKCADSLELKGTGNCVVFTKNKRT
ncbi:MAG: SpoIIE family protein phosphatase, partial [Chitinivibrionales bacterium]|nr:SpoIIE family protein phosphatase [Chitinivibrionales bacterium]